MAVNKELRKKAEDLGVTVDPRWSDTTLQARIDEKEADNEALGPGGIVPGSGVEDDTGPSKENIAGAAIDDKGKVLATEATPKAVKSGVGGLDEKGRLALKASQLNIMVDDKWDASRLRGEIQMARDGRADLQVKGAIPPAEWCDVNFDAGTKADKLGKQAGITPVEPIKIAGVTIAGEPAVMVPAPASGAVAASTVVSAETK